jgi:hypothetical protein
MGRFRVTGLKSQLGLDRQEFGVGSRQLKTYHLRVKNPNLFEYDLYQHEVDALGCFDVQPVWVSEQTQGFIE